MAPSGTSVVISESEVTVKEAGVPWNATLDAPVKPVPVISTVPSADPLDGARPVSWSRAGKATTTATGESLSGSTPSWPTLLSPQHSTTLFDAVTQASASPALTEAAPVTPTTPTAASTLSEYPSPSWPDAPSPQQSTAPDSIAHPPSSPALIWETPLRAVPDEFTTFSGEALSANVSEPSPSWPVELSPQQ